MKTLSSQPTDPLLKDIQELEEQLDDHQRSLEQLEASLENYDRADPERLMVFRSLTDLKFTLAKDFCRLSISKAKAGIVGYSWYNDKDRRS